MSDRLSTESVHHLRLTITDVERSRRFHTEVLNSEHIAALPSGVFLSNGAIGLGIGPSPDPNPAGDRSGEARVGLDHLSLQGDSLADLERAVASLDVHGVPHGEIKNLGEGFGIYVLAFHDPDSIQLELAAPRA